MNNPYLNVGDLTTTAGRWAYLLYIADECKPELFERARTVHGLLEAAHKATPLENPLPAPCLPVTSTEMHALQDALTEYGRKLLPLTESDEDLYWLAELESK